GSEGMTSQNRKVYALWTGEGRLEAGDMVSFAGEISPFLTQTVPSGYDEELYLKTEGFDYKIYPEWMAYEGADDSVLSRLACVRGRIHTVLDSLLPREESGIMKAMLTGDKADIPEEGYQLYTEAGVVHVLCISGLHMSCLALYVSFFMEKILQRSRRFSAAVTILTAMAFLAFTGSTPSSVRAVLMICVVMLGRILFRSHDRLNDIALAAMVLLLWEPLYLFHIGFQLSFVTVLGLCIAAEHIHIARQKDRTWKDWLRESLLFSLYATLFSGPIVAYHFHSVSLVGILANLLIIPLSGLLLGFGILSALLGLLWLPAGIFTAGIVYAILKLFQFTCTLLLKLPFAYILVGQPSLWTILLLYGLLFYWMHWSEKRHSWRIAAVFSAMLFLSVFHNSLFAKETTIAFLDVGQGDCAVISTYDGKHYLIDGGGKYGKEMGENTGKYTVLPYLEYLGADRLSAAFLSHPDRDHMIGLLEVLEEIPTEGLYVSDYPFGETEETLLLKETVEKNRIPLYTVTKGEEAEGFACLHPSKDFYNGEDNGGSMVLKYSYGGTSILFTGDISAAEEQYLLEGDTDVSADILKVSHHGSGSSSYADFLEAVDAETAVISCGKRNIYGHPHEDVLAKLEGTEVFRTDEDGTVLIHLRQDGTYTIETMTERKPFYENIKERLERT
ncbi:MAG: DNA internalization-related competence protein ComEC/Rec2, partial [Bacillota bacterium]|nr:DNA internalization-related competence protein ComEC/Rec2 [Bacillota bacterium]